MLDVFGDSFQFVQREAEKKLIAFAEMVYPVGIIALGYMMLRASAPAVFQEFTAAT